LSYQLLNSECKCTQTGRLHCYCICLPCACPWHQLVHLFVRSWYIPFHHRLSVSPHEVLTIPRMRVRNQLILQGAVYRHLIRKTFNDAFLIIFATRLHSGECTSTTEGPIAKPKLSSCSVKSKLVIGAKISFDKMWRMGGLSREGNKCDPLGENRPLGVVIIQYGT